jgi:hypothetical protein
MIQDECDTTGSDGESRIAMIAKITVFHHGIGRDLLFIGGMMARTMTAPQSVYCRGARQAAAIASPPVRRGALPHGVAALPQCNIAPDGAFGGAMCEREP